MCEKEQLCFIARSARRREDEKEGDSLYRAQALYFSRHVPWACRGFIVFFRKNAGI